MPLRDRITLREITLSFLRFFPQWPKIGLGLLRLLRCATVKNLTWDQFFRIQSQKFSELPLFLSDVESYTYGEVEALSSAYAHYFQESGVARGDTIAISLPNSCHYFMIFNGLLKLGVTPLLINPEFPQKIKEQIYDEAHVVGIVSLANSKHRFSYKDKAVGAITLDDHKDGAILENHKSSTDDTAVLICTSGTTGRGYKIALIKQRRLLLGATWFGAVLAKVRKGEVLFSPLPYFHATNLIVAWPSAVQGGGALVVEEKFSLSRFHAICQKWKVSCFIYVGELLTFLLNQEPSPKDSALQIRAVMGNGLRPKLWKRFKKRFAISEVYEFYGASESDKVFSNFFNVDETVGMCFGSFFIAQFDSSTGDVKRGTDGRVLHTPVGESGILLFKLPSNRSLSFYSDKESAKKKVVTAVKKVRDLWFNSGDLVQNLGYRHVRFIDRLGDTFRWKGENCSTSLVESVTLLVPGVDRALVFGHALDCYDGRCGMAVVEGGSDAHILDELPVYYREHLLKEAWPRFIRFVDSIELTNSFKLKKGAYGELGIHERSGDILYYLNATSGKYESLTEAVKEEIQSGTLKL